MKTALAGDASGAPDASPSWNWYSNMGSGPTAGNGSVCSVSRRYRLVDTTLAASSPALRLRPECGTACSSSPVCRDVSICVIIQGHGLTEKARKTLTICRGTSDGQASTSRSTPLRFAMRATGGMTRAHDGTNGSEGVRGNGVSSESVGEPADKSSGGNRRGEVE